MPHVTLATVYTEHRKYITIYLYYTKYQIENILICYIFHIIFEIYYFALLLSLI